jgi:hypothetical protein
MNDQAHPVPAMPPSQDQLTDQQKDKVLTFLKAGLPVTNFEVQRLLFGSLNLYCSVAIKKYLLSLRDEGLVEVTGQKRGQRYKYVG